MLHRSNNRGVSALIWVIDELIYSTCTAAQTKSPRSAAGQGVCCMTLLMKEADHQPVHVRSPQISRGSAHRKSASVKARRLSLALQGGGAFGAFTWGVLDRLLEDGTIAFDAVSGASAGAMNAVLLASGLARGGPREARASLERFWRKVSKLGRKGLIAPANPLLTAMAQALSPYQFNPLGLNPLRDILAEEVDLDAIRRNAPVRLLIGATRVSDGALRIFRNADISYDVVLASACLPHLHHAVAIDGEPHWDGGYAANPSIMPLISASRTSDVLLVQIIPSQYHQLPRTMSEIDQRLSQITFNTSLQKDLEALSAMLELCRSSSSLSSRLGRKLQRLRLARVAAEDHVDGLSASSFKNIDWEFLTLLREHGRAAAEAWLLNPKASALLPT
jgi:NTE family protein